VTDRRPGQDKTVLSCPCHRCELGITVYRMQNIYRFVGLLRLWATELKIVEVREQAK